jgi:hypothetical protein
MSIPVTLLLAIQAGFLLSFGTLMAVQVRQGGAHVRSGALLRPAQAPPASCARDAPSPAL